MSQPVYHSAAREAFESDIRHNPALLFAAQYIFDHAPQPLNDPTYVRSLFVDQDCLRHLIPTLHEHISAEDLAPRIEVNSTACDVWCFFALILMCQGKWHEGIEVLDSLYDRMLRYQAETATRCHKGLPLFRVSECYEGLGYSVHAKRYMMLALCEDAITGDGELNLRTTGTYGRLASIYGLSDRQIHSYARLAHEHYRADEARGAIPEWVLQHLDEQWKTEIPTAQECGVFRITRYYCRALIDRLGKGDGKDLEQLAEYLVGAMPGCRTYRRARTYSSEHDVIGSVEGPIADFRSECGRYFACECKDYSADKVAFADIAKFCRVLDSVKARFGIVFCPTGHTGAGKGVDADREIQKVFQDRGIVIVVVDRDDLQRIAEGANFISMLREKYEVVRLDLR